MGTELCRTFHFRQEHDEHELSRAISETGEIGIETGRKFRRPTEKSILQFTTTLLTTSQPANQPTDQRESHNAMLPIPTDQITSKQPANNPSYVRTFFVLSSSFSPFFTLNRNSGEEEEHYFGCMFKWIGFSHAFCGLAGWNRRLYDKCGDDESESLPVD